jgi:hypothetical protein
VFSRCGVVLASGGLSHDARSRALCAAAGGQLDGRVGHAEVASGARLAQSAAAATEQLVEPAGLLGAGVDLHLGADGSTSVCSRTR